MEEEEIKPSNKGRIVIIALALIVLIGGGYLLYGRNKTEDKGGVTNNNPVPATVAGVATVNGVVIPKSTYDIQLSNAIASYKAQGIDVTNADKLSQSKKQVLTSLVNNELLFQNVLAAGIKTTPEDVEKQFQLIVTQSGGADAFKAQLAKNNLTEAQLRENVSKQLAIQTYLSQNVYTKSIKISDAEIKKFYDDYSKQQKASGQKTVPTLKSLSAQIKQQLTSNKQQEMVASFVTSLQAKAKIQVTATI